ncbi:MAG: hypothetical protein ACYC6L_03080 [Anaerolineae bacterium]
MPKHGQRYTIGVVTAPGADPSALEAGAPLYRFSIGASEWLCFETRFINDHFWRDDHYRILRVLGFKFTNSGFGVGPHIDAYPLGFDPAASPWFEFWITVQR